MNLHENPVPVREGAGEAPERIVEAPEDIIYHTNTDESDYPIFVTKEREICVKRRPRDVVATFYVKAVNKVDAEIAHELLEQALKIVEDVTKNKPAVERLEIIYEVYAGDRERFIAEARAHAIRVISVETPYSGVKYSGSRAWAIGFDWKKRIVAKEPRLEKYVYIKGEEGKKGRAYVNVIVKLPVVTEEFNRLFNMALASATATQVSPVVADLEEQIKKLEELIKQKEQELQALREQLAQLQMRLQLEKMKKMVVE